MNEILDKEKIEKSIRIFYKTLLNREPDTKGLNFYTAQVIENSLTLDEVYDEMKNSSEASILKKTKLMENEIVFQSNHSKEEIKKYLEQNNTWYHAMNINGIQTKNTRTSSQYQMWISQVIPDDLTGKNILDVGCTDGFYSFLCEQRNANRMLAIDYEGFDKHKKMPESAKKINPNNFELYKKLLDSKVEYRKLDVYNIDLIKETFDFVLFFGVYYHLENLISALKKIYSVVSDSVFLAGHILESENPIMYYYDTSDITKHGSVDDFATIVASPQCLINIAKSICGFKNAELVDTMLIPCEKTYPHIFSGSKNDKIGLFKFSK
jgi:tRNA (mo5U34)-methyltransferase